MSEKHWSCRSGWTETTKERGMKYVVCHCVNTRGNHDSTTNRVRRYTRQRETKTVMRWDTNFKTLRRDIHYYCSDWKKKTKFKCKKGLSEGKRIQPISLRVTQVKRKSFGVMIWLNITQRKGVRKRMYGGY